MNWWLATNFLLLLFSSFHLFYFLVLAAEQKTMESKGQKRVILYSYSFVFGREYYKITIGNLLLFHKAILDCGPHASFLAF